MIPLRLHRDSNLFRPKRMLNEIKDNNVADSAGIASHKIDFGAFSTTKRSAVAGDIRWNGTTKIHQYYTGSGWGTLGLSGAATLDVAYNGGNEIDVDGSAVTFTGSHASNNTIYVTATGGSGNCIDINQAGSGYDIEGTSDTWHVSKAGAIVATDLTLTASTVAVTLDATTGSGFYIHGETVTTGNALIIEVDKSTMTSGLAINVYENDTAASVWSVADDGTTTIAGTAAGTASLVLTLGDITVTDGDIDVAGDVTITDSANTTALKVENDTLTTSDVVTINAAALTSGTGLRINLDESAVTTGMYLELYDEDTSAAMFTIGALGLTTIAGNATGTDALVLTAGDITLTDGALTLTTGGITLTAGSLAITDSDACTISSVNGTTTLLTLDNAGGVIADDAAVLSLDAGGAMASGSNILRLAPTGTPNAAAIGIEFVGAGKKLTALYIDADPTASSVAQINGGGALTSDLAVLTVSSDGALATGANTFRVDTTGTPASGAVYAEFDFAGITDTNENVGVWINAAAKKVVALQIDSAALTGSNVLVTSTGVLAADKATVELVSNVSACNADSAVLRLEQSHTTGVATCLAMKQDDVDIPFITFETTIGTGNAIEAIAAKSLTGTHFVKIDIEGTGVRYIEVGTIA